MLCREARQQREYVYCKAQEEKLSAIQEKKEKIKKALDENCLIPTELRKEALALQKSLEFDDGGAEGVTSHVDDEYHWAVVHEHRGVPDGLIVSHLPFGPTAYFTLCNVVMRHDIPDIGTMSEAHPQLIFHNFTSRLGQRVTSILKYLFPVPKDDSKRVITFANQDDYISYQHHVYKKTDHRNVELTEVGPRFEMKLYMIKLGTLEQESTADVEWRWHPYTHTAKKRKFLSIE
ncbi:hypothetical protein lerEdw1_013040 [Lerista edwardsae]|nr:hypothetical protein lerEdw1_013040 [Lerista edwardsae]